MKQTLDFLGSLSNLDNCIKLVRALNYTIIQCKKNIRMLV